MKLELGAGGAPTEGFEHADIRAGHHIEHVFDMEKPFPFDTASVDYVLMHQTLEHFSHRITDFILTECWRILHHGGTLQLSVPNLKGWMDAVSERRITWEDFIERAYGGQDYLYNYHKTGFSQSSLGMSLSRRGYKDIDFTGTCWTDIHVKGTKK